MRRLFKYLSKYSFLIFLSLLMAAISVISNLYIPVLVGQCLDCMISQAVNFSLLIPLLKKMLITVSITFISQYLLNLLNNRITFNSCCDIRNEAFNKLLTLPISYIDSHQSGEITSRIINDIDTLSDGLILGFTNFFTSILTIILTLVYMFKINVHIALLVFILTPLSLFAARFISKKTNSLFGSQAKIKGIQTAYIDEMVNNQKLVIAYNQQKHNQENFNEINKKLADTSQKAIFFSSLTNPTTRFINALIYAVIAISGATIVIGGTLSVGNLSTFLSYASQYTKPFNEISGVFVELQNSLACAKRVFQLIDQPNESTIQQPQNLNNDIQTIAFNNVCFSYNQNKPLLQNLNFHVQKGQKIALVGPTGCGKTTLINLLMRFYDIDSGIISMDNININNADKADLRNHFGMVLQESWLKQESIRDNLQMGRQCSDEEMINACKQCYIHSFIQRLPQQYDTVISENSDSISAGQKQLLCIARIMIQNPQILILDEATSNIDTRTEINVQKAFDRLMKNKTAFIVAHRLSTIINADCILVMKDGKIIEKGNHEELLKKHGFYYDLYNSQFQH
ncbi:MAG: ABC transporter ATP-binding protein [Erysipelotrichia bacterium]|nr:ABC transporter ATP-binding protein [Erysipelotrichia bacterium]